MNIAIFSTKEFEVPYLEKANDGKHKLDFIEKSLNQSTIELAKGHEGIITFPNDDLNKQVLEKLKDNGVKYITSRSAGIDHIELDAGKDLGLKFSYAPDYSPHAIAEHSVGMMLALNRNYFKANQKIHQHDFRLNGLIGFDMHGKTVGILGAGKIGGALCRILHGFGCNIIIYDPVQDEELVEKYDARYVGIEELCRKSDIISIHAPLNKSTKYLINKEKIALMKEGVMIINAGRGPIIKTTDLIEGLKNGRIGKVGLDVYENEKGLFFYNHEGEPLEDEMFAYLEANNKVFITAHQAFTTETALTNMAEAAFDSLNKWEQGKEAEYEL